MCGGGAQADNLRDVTHNKLLELLCFVHSNNQAAGRRALGLASDANYIYIYASDANGSQQAAYPGHEVGDARRVVPLRRRRRAWLPAQRRRPTPSAAAKVAVRGSTAAPTAAAGAAYPDAAAASLHELVQRLHVW